MSWLTKATGLDTLKNQQGILNRQSSDLMGKGQNIFDKGQGLLDFSDPFYSQYGARLNRQLKDSMAFGANQIGSQMAMTGESGGIGAALRKQFQNKSSIGEQERTGLESMYTQGIGMGTNLMNSASQFTGQGVQASGIAGDLASQRAQMQGDLFTGAVNFATGGGIGSVLGGLGGASSKFGGALDRFGMGQNNPNSFLGKFGQGAGSFFSGAGQGMSSLDQGGNDMQQMMSLLSLAQSDIRLKTDIELTGQSPTGVNTYSFKYKGDDKTYEGVMAQEVPWASIKGDDGYYLVDYSKVDVTFKRLN